MTTLTQQIPVELSVQRAKHLISIVKHFRKVFTQEIFSDDQVVKFDDMYTNTPYKTWVEIGTGVYIYRYNIPSDSTMYYDCINITDKDQMFPRHCHDCNELLIPHGGEMVDVENGHGYYFDNPYTIPPNQMHLILVPPKMRYTVFLYKNENPEISSKLQKIVKTGNPVSKLPNGLPSL